MNPSPPERDDAADRPDISVVVPFHDEEATLIPLYERIAAVLDGLGRTFELVLIDDGSRDASVARAEELVARDARVALVQLRGNFGKSAALAAGFDECRGEIVLTLDADLQDAPEELPRFLELLAQGHDVDSGFKQVRHDPWHKVLPSRVFNWIVRRVTGVRLRDVNCGFKAYRRAVIEEVQVYGSLHRFIPVLAHWRRFRIAELVVQHYPRQHGQSKFGVGRFYEGLVDLLTVTFLMRYDRKPAHFFGRLGLLCSLAGFACCLYLSMVWLAGHGPIGDRPLLLLGVLLLIVGVQFVATGLLAELLSRSTNRWERPYSIARRVQRTAEAPATARPNPSVAGE